MLHLQSITEGLGPSSAARRAAAELWIELLDLVSLPRSSRKRLSCAAVGWSAPRVAIAWAFAMRPTSLVADEPVSALDVSMQGQVLNLLRDLRARFSLTCDFVSHDLSIVQQFCERVIVMEKRPNRGAGRS